MKALGIKNEEGGDAEIETHIYQKGNQMLQIEKVEVGDYGYSRTHQLLDEKGNLLKKRTLFFSADANPKVITETVFDYTSNPAKQFTRTQSIKKHHSQLNARPMFALGNWEVISIDASNK